MALENMTAEQIENELNELGESGSARITIAGELKVKREENSSELYVGTIANVEEAKAVIERHFA